MKNIKNQIKKKIATWNYQELRGQEEEHCEVDEDGHHAAGLHRRDEGGQDHKAGHDQSNHVGEERIGLESMIFCYQNCSDLLWEKNCPSEREKLFEIRDWRPAKNFKIFWDH